MSSHTSALLLVSLPLFWTILSWFTGRTQNKSQKLRVERIAIFGSVSLFLFSLLIGFTFAADLAPGTMLVTLTPLKALITLTVVAIGVILMRFSRNYLVGEACYPAFLRWMQLTLSAVVVTILANHFIVFWLGWLSVSLSLHHLLLLYPDRPRAIIAAHKKFLLARTSELIMAGAFTLLYLAFDTLYIDELLGKVDTLSLLTHTQYTYFIYATCLLAVAALLKCAQLPAHGWLINIVESATPVSALLHAGVINLGGYLLLTFAPLIAAVPQAQWIILIAAGLSVFFSSLIMTTRVTIKVRLAWSTSSQMGLMLIECAMGLYALAVIHLVAHSFYKAYAFLNSGSAVYEQLEHDISAHRSPTFADWLNAAFITMLVILATYTLSAYQGPLSPWILVSLALTSFLAMRTAHSDQTQLYIFVGIAVALITSYSLVKGLVQSHIVAGLPSSILPFSAMDLWISTLFIGLFAIHCLMQSFANHRVVKKFKQYLFAGFYLDEWFTKVTLKVYPVKLRSARPHTSRSATVSKIGSM